VSGLFLPAQPEPSQRLQIYAKGEDFMAARMDVLQVIADIGPCRKCDIISALPGSTHTQRLQWLSEQCLISITHGTHKTALYCITSSGRRRLIAGNGEPVRAPQLPLQPRSGPTRDEVWGYVRPEGLRAFDAPSAGVPT